MGTPIAFNSGTTANYQAGIFKKATIGLNLSTPLVSGTNWWNGVDVTTSQYLIYSDIYSQGQSTFASSRPTAWTTPDLTDASLIALINTLPDRVGLIGFTTVSQAVNWLNQTGKYFLIKLGYENIVTSNIVLSFDAGWYNSYIGSGTAWNDLSGNGLNGTLTNGPTFNTNDNGSIQFDGTNDYVNTTYNSLYNFSNANFTVEAWFYANTVSNGTYISIAMRATYGSNERSFELYVANDSGTPYIWFGIFNSGWTYVNNPSLTNIQYNNWYHVVATSDGSGNGKVYINGVLKQTNTSFNTAVTVTTVPFQIGAYVGGASGGWFNGKIPIVRLYNTALTSTQVLQNFNAQAYRFGVNNELSTSGLQSYLTAKSYLSYPGSGTAWYDLSGNNYNGTLVNGPTYSSNGYITFDGSDDRCNVTNSIPSLSNLTIEFFLNTLTVDGTQNIFLDQYLSLRYEISSDNKFRIHLGNGSGWFFTSDSSTTTVVANTWYHTAWTWNGSQSIIYINGVADATYSHSPGSSGTGTITLGQHTPDTSYAWNGQMNTFRIYDRALSSTEIKQNFYLGNIPTTNLVMLLDAANLVSYPASGTNLKDISGQGNNATLYNGTSFSTNNGGVMVYDGTDDYIRVNRMVSDDFSLGIWFKTSTASPTGTQWYQGQGFLDSEYPGAVNDFGLSYLNNKAVLGTGAPDTTIQGTTSLNDGVWKFIVGTRQKSNGQLLLYVNGVLEASGTGNTNSLTASSYIWIGSSNGGVGSYGTLNGNVGPIFIYDKVLTTIEITNIFNAYKSRYGL